MGQVKQLLPFRGKPLVSHIIETALASQLHEVIVVLGYKAKEIIKAIDFGDAQVVMNNDYEVGQTTSLRIGISAISKRSVAALFLLGDQPLVTISVINRLVEKYDQESMGLLIPMFQGKRGNPVLVSRSFFPCLESLSGDQGARALFEEYTDQIKEIDIGEDCILFDIDTMEDYSNLISK
jgi:molybdenum cofactor cytidylyltransferase